MLKKIVFPFGSTSIVLPDDWNPLHFNIDLFGAGGAGAGASGGGGNAFRSGGGGEFRRITQDDVTLNPGDTLAYSIGAGGVFGATVNGGDTVITGYATAKGGQGGVSGGLGGTGGTGGSLANAGGDGSVPESGGTVGPGGNGGAAAGTPVGKGFSGGRSFGTDDGAGGGGGASTLSTSTDWPGFEGGTETDEAAAYGGGRGNPNETFYQGQATNTVAGTPGIRFGNGGDGSDGGGGGGGGSGTSSMNGGNGGNGSQDSRTNAGSGGGGGGSNGGKGGNGGLGGGGGGSGAGGGGSGGNGYIVATYDAVQNIVGDSTEALTGVQAIGWWADLGGTDGGTPADPGGGGTDPNNPTLTADGVYAEALARSPVATRALQMTGVRAQSHVGVIGGVNMATVSMTLPVPRLAIIGVTGAAAGVAMTLPIPKLAITGGGIGGSVDMRLPSLRLQATGLVGASGAVRLTLPVPRLSIQPASSVALRLPVPQLATSGTTGIAGSVSMRLPALRLVSAGQQSVMGDVALQLRAPTLAITALTGQAAGVSLVLPRLALAIEGQTGVVGRVALRMPLLRLAVEGYGEHIGHVQLTLPALLLSVTGRVSAGAPQTFVMHTETMALTQYDNFPFNSFAQFNGVVLGASDNGLFALSGATDAGAAINAFARVGISDFGTSHLKRVDRIYVGYRSDGDLVLRVLTDETQQRDYLLRASGGGLHGSHARLGRGVDARYWQFEVRNVDGSDFDINTIELKPTTLRRRVGSRDA